MKSIKVLTVALLAISSLSAATKADVIGSTSLPGMRKLVVQVIDRLELANAALVAGGVPKAHHAAMDHAVDKLIESQQAGHIAPYLAVAAEFAKDRLFAELVRLLPGVGDAVAQTYNADGTINAARNLGTDAPFLDGAANVGGAALIAAGGTIGAFGGYAGANRPTSVSRNDFFAALCAVIDDNLTQAELVHHDASILDAIPGDTMSAMYTEAQAIHTVIGAKIEEYITALNGGDVNITVAGQAGVNRVGIAVVAAGTAITRNQLAAHLNMIVAEKF